MTKIRKQEELYKLIISQLKYDGFSEAASLLEKEALPKHQTGPSTKLSILVEDALAKAAADTADREPRLLGDMDTEMHELDLDAPMNADDVAPTKEAAEYQLTYTTIHKSPCRAVAFSPDGKYAASAASDASIKIMDTARMLMRVEGGGDDSRPVLRTLFDHTQPITSIDFHPQGNILVSGGQDCAVKFFDFSRMNAKRASRSLAEASPIRTVRFHPSGQFLLVGTDQPEIRMYDVKTLKCYASANVHSYHTGAINAVWCNPDGRFYVSCSTDGAIKVWDGASSRCVNTFAGAHGCAEVTSVQISRNGKYILSAGKDNTCRLFDISAGRLMTTYSDVNVSRTNMTACFSFDEAQVLCGDELSNNIVTWDARSGARLRSYSGHSGPPNALAAHPRVTGFLSGGADSKARFWSFGD